MDNALLIMAFETFFRLAIALRPLRAAIATQPKIETCAPKPYMGDYILELEREDSGFRVVCQLHHYYEATCSCGHISQAKPGQGYVFSVEGRSRDLKLTEYRDLDSFWC
jgi:hypothetical protein